MRVNKLPRTPGYSAGKINGVPYDTTPTSAGNAVLFWLDDEQPTGERLYELLQAAQKKLGPIVMANWCAGLPRGEWPKEAPAVPACC